MNIVVYCSSREDLDREYVETAEFTGKWIGANHHTLVYGGVKAGMMHVVANHAKNAGGKVLGVIPQRFEHRADELNDELIVTTDLSDRKAKMIEIGDLFVVLPGGLGTIDEWMATLSQLVVEDDNVRKIVVVNINGIYDSLIEQVRQTANSKFARSATLNSSIIVNNIEELNLCLTKIDS